jgi:hypothetical protein
VRQDRLQRLEHAVGARLRAARTNVEIAPDHQAGHRTADMFGVAKSTEGGHECKVRKHLTSLGLQASLALAQFGRVRWIELAYLHICPAELLPEITYTRV